MSISICSWLFKQFTIGCHSVGSLLHHRSVYISFPCHDLCGPHPSLHLHAVAYTTYLPAGTTNQHWKPHLQQTLQHSAWEGIEVITHSSGDWSVIDRRVGIAVVIRVCILLTGLISGYKLCLLLCKTLGWYFIYFLLSNEFIFFIKE